MSISFLFSRVGFFPTTQIPDSVEYSITAQTELKFLFKLLFEGPNLSGFCDILMTNIRDLVITFGF